MEDLSLYFTSDEGYMAGERWWKVPTSSIFMLIPRLTFGTFHHRSPAIYPSSLSTNINFKFNHRQKNLGGKSSQLMKNLWIHIFSYWYNNVYFFPILFLDFSQKDLYQLDIVHPYKFTILTIFNQCETLDIHLIPIYP